jgi:UDP-3-O-[3-hydroxymyristoyl] N-acetylglucosamine deacetylase
MELQSQTTLARAAVAEGVGLHSGASARVTLRPAAPGRGIVLRRAGAGEIVAGHDAISCTDHNTGLGEGERRVATVEHLMAALALAEIDNILVEIDGPELPALDGSAAPWLDAIFAAGIRDLDVPRETIRVTAPVVVEDAAGRSVRAEPCDGRIIEVSISFRDAAIGAQKVTLDLDNPADVRRVASARTFCSRADIEALRAKGLSRGGSLDNAVVVDGDSILNPSGLRDPLEFALHKALDLIGDLRLAGAPIIGRIIAVRPGHDLNARFLAALARANGSVVRGRDAAGPLRASA